MAFKATSGDFASQKGLLPAHAGADGVLVPDAQLLLGGSYERSGDDLSIRGDGGAGLFVQGYFASESPPPLVTPGEAMLRADIVAKLAGPRAAGQYAQAGSVEQAQAIGQVEGITGNARVVRLGTPVELSPGDPVYQNDVVETGLNSELVIGFADGTIFSLSANARMVLNAMIYNPAGSSNALNLSVLQGVFSFVTGQVAPTGEMRIDTPVATLGIRGTTVHGILQSIAGPLTVFLGTNQHGSTARAALLDPLTGSLIANIDSLTAAYYLSGLGAQLQTRPQSSGEQQFILDRAGTIHGVQSDFQFQFGSGEPIDQPGEVLRTQAGPNNNQSGGIGYDRDGQSGEAILGDLIGGLDATDPLLLLEGLRFSLLLRSDTPSKFGSTAVSARIVLAEANPFSGEVSTTSGNVNIIQGSTPIQSYALVGLSFNSGGTQQTLTSGGVPINVVSNGTQAQGFAGGTLVFTFQLNQNGSFTFSLLQPLDHPIAGAVGTNDTIEIGLEILVTFTDGTTLETIIVSSILDSGPTSTSDAGVLNESNELGVPVSGQLPIIGGGDGVKSVAVIGLAAPLSSGGQAVSLVQIANDTYVGVTSGGAEVFRLVFDSAVGSYTYTQSLPIDHSGAGADSQNLVFRVAVTDGDSDTVISTISIAVADSVPSTGANAQASVQESALVDGSGGGTTLATGTLNFTAGADGARISTLSLGGQMAVVQGSELVLTGAFFELRVDTITGAYVYTLTDNTLAHVGGQPLVQSFTYTVRDGDGDIALGQLNVQIDDDGVVARDDTNTVAEGDADGDGIGNQVTGNVILGADAASADVTGADGPVRVTQVSFGGIVVLVPSDNTDVVIAGAFGSLTIRADGTYTYTAPLLGSIQADQVETFTYMIADGEGNADSADLTIDLINKNETLNAFLVTNTNQATQSIRVIVSFDDAQVLASRVIDLAKTGQEAGVPLGQNGILLDPNETYALILKFDSALGSVNLTDFDLIFDLSVPNLDAPSNVFLTVLDQGTIQLGTLAGSADGVIWLADGDGSNVGPAILYDVKQLPDIDDTVFFDTEKSNTSFDLELSLLPVGGNTAGATALFGNVEALDIAGSQASEVNTLTLRAQDVIDTTDANNRLVILGDNDTVVIADPQNWVDGNPATAALDPIRTGDRVAGSGETFAVYQTLAGAELYIDDDLIVQSQVQLGVV